MSHKATNWAIEQRGIEPATKLLLWHLADCHNPSQGCFPSQDYLAGRLEMSRSSVNRHLKILETRGFISRIQAIDPITKRQKSTQYLLAGVNEIPEVTLSIEQSEPCPKSGHGAVSQITQEPCPKSDQSRVPNSDTNPVKEPVTQPVSESGGRDLFNELWNMWPHKYHPKSHSAAKVIFSKKSDEEQLAAVTHAATHIIRCTKLKKPLFLIQYVRENVYHEYVGAPPLSNDGKYRITPDREEWRAWLGSVRNEHGEKGVQQVVMWKHLDTETRWPAGHVHEQA